MKVTIACISPYLGDDGLGIYMVRTYARYALWAKKSTEKYSKVVIQDTKDWETIHVTLIDKKVVAHDIFAMDIANDFMQYANLKNEGGMIIQGDDPTDVELAMMEENRMKWLDSSIALGDQIFQRLGGPGVSHIPDYAKRACVERGVYPEWSYRSMVARAQCANCGSDVKVLRNGAMPKICANCKESLVAPEPTLEVVDGETVPVSASSRRGRRD